MNYQTIALALRMISRGGDGHTQQHTLGEIEATTIDGWKQLSLFGAAAHAQDSAAAEATGT